MLHVLFTQNININYLPLEPIAGEQCCRKFLQRLKRKRRNIYACVNKKIKKTPNSKDK